MKFKISTPAKKLLITLVAVLIISLSGLSSKQISNTLDFARTNQPGLYEVVQIDDGDTITVVMGGQTERIRMIGVDTPELHHPDKPVQCYAHQAQRFTAQLIAGSRVRLQADPLDDNRDLYGRLLRYVYLPDGTFVNAELIKQGYGFAYTHFPFSKRAEVVQWQQAAQTDGRGLWSSCKIEVTSEGLQTNSL